MCYSDMNIAEFDTIFRSMEKFNNNVQVSNEYKKNEKKHISFIWIILRAMYSDILSINDTCKQIAEMIKNKTYEETGSVQALFKLNDDREERIVVQTKNIKYFIKKYKEDFSVFGETIYFKVQTIINSLETEYKNFKIDILNKLDT